MKLADLGQSALRLRSIPEYNGSMTLHKLSRLAQVVKFPTCIPETLVSNPVSTPAVLTEGCAVFLSHVGNFLEIIPG